MRLSGFEKRIIASIAEAIIPSDNGNMPGALDVGVVEYVEERILKSLDWWMGLLLRFYFLAFEFLPILVLFYPARFSSLSVKKRAYILSRWENHRFYLLRLGYILLKTMCSMSYFPSNAVRAKMGMDELRDGYSTSSLVLPDRSV
ncbi:MAG: hypothetical protein FJ088_16535, partial [Deltaproteobacteria bacterium]|nr:hypothetical protein [Deltaproteobacteria bacterium]